MASETGQRSTPWTDYKGLSDDVIISRQIKILLSSYRRDDYADPDGFVLQLAALFERQPRNVIVEVTNPLNTRSIQRKHPTYPPNIGEVAEAIEAEAAEQARIVKALSQPKPIFRKREYVPPRNDPGCWANVFVHEGAPQYAGLKAWSESAEADERAWKLDASGRPGIWVALTIWDAMCGGRITVGRQIGAIVSDADLRARYGRAEAEFHDSSTIFDPPSTP